MIGILYIVTTHIGNPDDLSLRARRVLSECDIVICEELKPARQLLKHLGLFKELVQINEHNEKENTALVIDLLNSGKNCCLISDAGAPIFSDPGNFLLNEVYKTGIQVSFIPGPDSLIPSLIVSGFDVSKFYFAGWLSAKSEERLKQLKNLVNIEKTIAIMDTPYRLKSLLQDILKIFGPNKKISVVCDLTTENEMIIRGKIDEVFKIIDEKNLKCEFVLIIDNKK